ncbi:hypothetical protein BZL29_3132 [Mycobacterium kansasii]|uniref:Uncharacterized protein n=3 Tax=Mycobacterium kansasii TaxID=1768 RepID=A0A1V3XF96_MYCKA|nr:hypothetical protein BZL29_3132 [Mycobacterium kansasii]
MTVQHTNPPSPPATGAAAGRRHSTGVVIAAAVAGLAIGALAVFAVTGVTWKIRVELPAPLYPPALSSAPPVSNPRRRLQRRRLRRAAPLHHRQHHRRRRCRRCRLVSKPLEHPGSSGPLQVRPLPSRLLNTPDDLRSRMTSDENTAASGPVPTPAPVAPPPAVVADPGRERRRFSLAALIGAGVAGLILGAAGSVAAIAFAWLISVGPPPPPPGSGPMQMPGQAFSHGQPPPPGPGGPPGPVAGAFRPMPGPLGVPRGPRPPAPPQAGPLGPGQPPGAPGQPPGLPPSMQTSPTPRP